MRAHVGEAAFNVTATYFWIQIVDLARTLVARDGKAGDAQPLRLAWSAFRFGMSLFCQLNAVTPCCISLKLHLAFLFPQHACAHGSHCHDACIHFRILLGFSARCGGQVRLRLVKIVVSDAFVFLILQSIVLGS